MLHTTETHVHSGTHAGRRLRPALRSPAMPTRVIFASRVNGSELVDAVAFLAGALDLPALKDEHLDMIDDDEPTEKSLPTLSRHPFASMLS